jgi:predicted nucleic acid-binding protein
MSGQEQRSDPRQVGLAGWRCTTMIRPFLAEDARVADRLQGLLVDVECKGKQVHDANVVATMLAHGVGTVVTMNVADFARFERYVSLVEL